MLASSRRPAGSSPRVRGKLRADPITELGERIIPARAGQTSRKPKIGSGIADHPRACGANSNGKASEKSILGSSPRVRGKRGKEKPPWL